MNLMEFGFASLSKNVLLWFQSVCMSIKQHSPRDKKEHKTMSCGLEVKNDEHVFLNSSSGSLFLFDADGRSSTSSSFATQSFFGQLERGAHLSLNSMTLCTFIWGKAENIFKGFKGDVLIK